MFDETNGSQVEQVDLDELDDEEAPCVALRNMLLSSKMSGGWSGPEAGRSARAQSRLGFRVLCYGC